MCMCRIYVYVFERPNGVRGIIVGKKHIFHISNGIVYINREFMMLPRTDGASAGENERERERVSRNDTAGDTRSVINV